MTSQAGPTTGPAMKKERKMDEKKIKELLEEIEKLKGDKYLSAHLGWMQIANLATDLLRKEK